MPGFLKYDSKALGEFSAKYPLRYFKKGRPLFYQGEVPQSIFYIKSGVVKMYNITSTGEEKTIGLDGPGGIIPMSWLFDRSSVSMYYYDTFTDCQLHSIPKNDMAEFIASDSQMTSFMLDRTVSMYISATLHLHALEQSKARDKLLYIFQYLVMRFGKPVGPNQSRIDLRLTHQDIANLIGITRETASTEIGKLMKANVIKINSLHYVVDTDKVIRNLGENDFSELEL